MTPIEGSLPDFMPQIDRWAYEARGKLDELLAQINDYTKLVHIATYNDDPAHIAQYNAAIRHLQSEAWFFQLALKNPELMALEEPDRREMISRHVAGAL